MTAQRAVQKEIDVSFYRKSKMAALKTEAEITFELLEISMRFQLLRYPDIFDKVRLGYDNADIARHFPTSAAYRIQNGGNGNRKWK